MRHGEQINEYAWTQSTRLCTFDLADELAAAVNASPVKTMLSPTQETVRIVESLLSTPEV